MEGNITVKTHMEEHVFLADSMDPIQLISTSEIRGTEGEKGERRGEREGERPLPTLPSQAVKAGFAIALLKALIL